MIGALLQFLWFFFSMNEILKLLQFHKPERILVVRVCGGGARRRPCIWQGRACRCRCSSEIVERGEGCELRDNAEIISDI